MPEFLELLPPGEALMQWLPAIDAPLPAEEIEASDALGRVTAEAVIASHAMPSFARSTVDGYAVRGVDTFGASDTLPAYLELVGEVPMGAAAGLTLHTGQCALIHTGGMLPDAADAVVMVEQTQIASAGEIEVLRAVAAGENVLKIGEDVAQGECVIASSTRLRPAEIGGLMALGITCLRVRRQPRVGILSSGDEVIPPAQPIGPGQVRDINAYSLAALARQNGAIPVLYGIVPDRADALLAAAAPALQACDVLVISAGSSASTRDLTAQVVNSLGRPGVLVHGVNVRPGKPTILAACQGKAVIGLPGNPVSALVIAQLFLAPVIEHLLGLSKSPSRPYVPATLAINLSSQAGREDWIAVRVLQHGGKTIAEPVFGKSNLIFSLARADGMIRIPPDATGLPAGSEVQVFLF